MWHKISPLVNLRGLYFWSTTSVTTSVCARKGFGDLVQWVKDSMGGII